MKVFLTFILIVFSVLLSACGHSTLIAFDKPDEFGGEMAKIERMSVQTNAVLKYECPEKECSYYPVRNIVFKSGSVHFLLLKESKTRGLEEDSSSIQATKMVMPTDYLMGIEFNNRGRGALTGLAIGSGWAFSTGYLLGANNFDHNDDTGSGFQMGSFFSLLVSPASALLGAVIGSKTSYKNAKFYDALSKEQEIRRRFSP